MACRLEGEWARSGPLSRSRRRQHRALRSSATTLPSPLAFTTSSAPTRDFPNRDEWQSRDAGRRPTMVRWQCDGVITTRTEVCDAPRVAGLTRESTYFSRSKRVSYACIERWIHGCQRCDPRARLCDDDATVAPLRVSTPHDVATMVDPKTVSTGSDESTGVRRCCMELCTAGVTRREITVVRRDGRALGAGRRSL